MKRLLISLLLLVMVPVLAGEHYESIPKDDAFRASVELEAGAAFAELSQG